MFISPRTETALHVQLTNELISTITSVGVAGECHGRRDTPRAISAFLRSPRVCLLGEQEWSCWSVSTSWSIVAMSCFRMLSFSALMFSSCGESMYTSVDDVVAASSSFSSSFSSRSCWSASVLSSSSAARSLCRSLINSSLFYRKQNQHFLELCENYLLEIS